MSISFKNPDGTYTIDAATYRRHTNPSGEPGGVVDLRIEVGNNVTILEGLAVCGSGVLSSGVVINRVRVFGTLRVFEWTTWDD